MVKEKNNNSKAKIITIIFLCILIYPITDQTFKITKRKLTDQVNVVKEIVNFPSLHKNNLNNFPNLFEKYINYKFNLQDLLIKINSYFKIKFFKASPDPNKANFGKDGWLFWGHFTDNFRGINLFTNEDLKKLKKILDDRGKWYRSKNIRFYFTIAPDKPSIYPEFMPSWIQKVIPITLYDQIINLFRNDTLVSVIDLRKHIIENKNKGLLVYNKIDHHWNDLGAFYAYQTIINKIKIDFPTITPLSLNDYKIDTSEKYVGSESEMLNISSYFNEHRVKLIKKIHTKSHKGQKANYTPPDWFPFPKDYEVVSELDDKKLPFAFIIRDSYADFMLQYFQENFRKCKYLYDGWAYRFNKKIIESEKPDIVILMPYESNLKEILKCSDN